jgi:hypothetical protein
MITLFENFENQEGSNLFQKITVYRGSNSTKLYSGIRFFTSNPKTASFFGKNVYKAEIFLENPFVVDAMGNRWSEIPIPPKMKKYKVDKFHSSHPTRVVDTDLIVEWSHKKDYDGVIIKNVLEGMGNTEIADDYVIFDTNNVLNFELNEV